MNEKLIELADSIVADGVMTEKERTILRKKAQEYGEDPDEAEVLVEGRIDALRNNSNSSQRNKWCFIEPDVFPPLSDLDDVLTQIRQNTNDANLRMIRMRRAIYSFPLPKEKSDILEILDLLVLRLEKKKSGMFTKKREKIEFKEHNAMIPLWKEKGKEIILESCELYRNDKQTQMVLDNYKEKFDLF